MILKGRENASPSPVFPAGCLGFPSVSGLLSPPGRGIRFCNESRISTL